MHVHLIPLVENFIMQNLWTTIFIHGFILQYSLAYLPSRQNAGIAKISEVLHLSQQQIFEIL